MDQSILSVIMDKINNHYYNSEDKDQKKSVSYIIDKLELNSIDYYDIHMLKECFNRQYPLSIEVPEREELVDDFFNNNNIIYQVVYAGRRSGKSETFKRLVAHSALINDKSLPIYVGAPILSQTKDLYQDDLNLLTFSYFHKRKPNLSNLKIFLDNGNSIELKSLDTPQRQEGRNILGVLIDEVEDVKKKTFWEEHIEPALATLFDDGYKPFALIGGVPEQGGVLEKFVNEYCAKSNNYKEYNQPSSRVLSQEVLHIKRELLPLDIYLQEYEAKFIKPQGTIYYDYDPNLNSTDLEIKEDYTLHQFHDQNYRPLSSGLGIKSKNNYYILDEFILDKSDAYKLMEEFLHRYNNHKNKNIFIQGDRYGNSHFSNFNTTYYTIIENTLRENGQNPIMNIPKANPPIVSRQNSVKLAIRNANGNRHLFVNLLKAPTLNKGLIKSKVKKGTAYQEDDSVPEHHIGCALGYQIHPSINKDNNQLNELNGTLYR